MENQSKKKIGGIIARYVIAFLFVISWAVLGVALAIDGGRVTVAGGINFEASGIQATVTGKVEGTETAVNPEQLDFTYETTSFSTPTSWKGWDLTFQKGGKDITITITIENLNKERSFYVIPSDNISVDNIKITRKIDRADISDNKFYPIECTTQGTDSSKRIITIVASIENKSKGVKNGAFNLNFTLTEEARNSSEFSTLSFTYDDTNGTATVAKGATAPTGDLVIPSYIICNDASKGTVGNLYKVTQVATEGFKDCDKITSVTLPEGITSIGASAFEGCVNMKSANIPEGVTSINASTFGNSGLTSIHIPSGVTSIDQSAFTYCGKLATLTVDENNPKYHSYQNNGIYEGTTLIVGGVDINIENGTTKIANYALSGRTATTNITIPDSVTEIGAAAFNELYHLKSLTLPKNLKSIGYKAFQYNQTIKSLVIPASVTSISGVAFFQCISLTSVTFEDRYGWKAGGENSDSLDLSNTTQNATYLTSTYVSQAWTKSTPDASEFQTLAFSAIDGTTASVKENSSNKPTGELFIPGKVKIDGTEYTVTTIASGAFFDGNMTSIKLPNTITNINSDAFNWCNQVTSLSIEANSTYYSEGNGIYSGTTLVLGCQNTEIKAGTTIIGYSAFNGQSYNKSIILPDSVTEIQEAAFNENYRATTIKLSKNLEKIGDRAFSYLGNVLGKITTIEFPSSLKEIGYRAFYNCSYLKSITIPANVTSIGSEAFSGCPLETVCIDSPTIAGALTSETACGEIIKGLSTFYIKNGINSVGSYISDNFVRATSSDKTGYYKYIKDISSFKLISSEPDINNVAQEKVFTQDGELHLLTSEASFQIQIDAPFETSEYFSKFDNAFTIEILDDGYSTGNLQAKRHYDYIDDYYISWTIDDNGNFTIEHAYVVGRSIKVSYRNGKKEISIKLYSEAYEALLYDSDQTAITDNGERGLQQLRVFGNQSYYNGSLKNYYRVYDCTSYDYSDFNKLPTWSVNNGASLSYDSEYGGASCLDIDFSNVTPCTFDEIYNCTDPSTLTNGVVQLVAKNYFGHVLKTYTFIVVEGINVFDADGYVNAGKNLVMQTDLDYNGSNSSLNLNGYNYKTTIYGNGHKINYGWRNNDEIYGKQEETYTKYGYIPVVVTNLINLEIQGTDYDSTKASYNIQLQDVQKMAYCNVHDMFRILGYNTGTVNIKNCVFSRCKDSGILLASASASISSNEKILNLENVMMFDVGSRALELQYKSTVNISGFFDVYNFQSKDSLSNVDGLSSANITTIMNKAEDSGLTMTYNGETYVNLVGISTKTTSVNVNGGSLTKISGILNSYLAWAYAPNKTSTSGATLSYDNEFDANGNLNTTYLESQLTKITRKGK